MKMTDAEFARAWLEKADHDLQAARHLLPESARLADVICFHAQQAIEKAIKALCTAHGVRFEKTHDLIELLDLVLPFTPWWEKERGMLGAISAYAVDLRYPGKLTSPSTQMTQNGIELATRVLEEAQQHLNTMDSKSEGERP